MLFQLALDAPFTQDSLPAILEAAPYLDIIEIGTPAVYAMGMQSVRMLRKALPNAVLLADLKIADAGEYETQIALDAGADIVTVLASAADETVLGAVKAARACGKRISADLIGVPDPLGRAARIEEMGVDILCAHTGLDRQQADGAPFALCKALLAQRKTAQIAVAGGITTRTIPLLADVPADICIVGGGITKCASLQEGTLAIRQAYRASQNN